jgi:hypothetical protein
VGSSGSVITSFIAGVGSFPVGVNTFTGSARVYGTDVKFTSTGTLLVSKAIRVTVLPPTPGAVTGATLWIKANDGAINTGNNTTVTSLLDKAGANTFTTFNTPLFQSNPGSNFNPSVKFNGTSTSFIGNTAITMNDVYAVGKYTDPALGNQ